MKDIDYNFTCTNCGSNENEMKVVFTIPVGNSKRKWWEFWKSKEDVSNIITDYKEDIDFESDNDNDIDYWKPEPDSEVERDSKHKNMNFKELKEWIKNELPIDGEWYSDGYETFIDCAVNMLNSGMNINDIKEILEKLHSAVSQEFE